MCLLILIWRCTVLDMVFLDYLLVWHKIGVDLYIWCLLYLQHSVSMFGVLFVGGDSCKPVQSHIMIELAIILPSGICFVWPCFGCIFADPLRPIGGKIKDDLRWVPSGIEWLKVDFGKRFMRVMVVSVCSSLMQAVFNRTFCSEGTCLAQVDTFNHCYGLKWWIETGFENGKLKSDCLALIETVKWEMTYLEWESLNLVGEIENLGKTLGSCCFEWIPRRLNLAANGCAQAARSDEEVLERLGVTTPFLSGSNPGGHSEES